MPEPEDWTGQPFRFADFAPPEPNIPESPGHWNEWVRGCKTGSPTSCNFDYAGRLTETVLLGIVAYRSGQRLEWDAASLAVKNTAAAKQFLRKDYRQGFGVAGI